MCVCVFLDTGLIMVMRMSFKKQEELGVEHKHSCLLQGPLIGLSFQQAHQTSLHLLNIHHNHGLVSKYSGLVTSDT